MKAFLTNLKQSPRKVRLVADMVRGKPVAVAKDMLAFLPKKSAPEIEKLLASAVANARLQGVSAHDLVVKSISVDKGTVLRRYTPKARGRAGGIRRTMSHVSIELGVAGNGAAPKKSARKTTKSAASKLEPRT
jgi:large subunit ribosomal protein L22